MNAIARLVTVSLLSLLAMGAEAKPGLRAPQDAAARHKIPAPLRVRIQRRLRRAVAKGVPVFSGN